MKNSTKVLISFLTLCLAYFLLVGINRAKGITITENTSPPKIIEADGEYLIDTIAAEYSHIVTDFPALTYDVRMSDQIIVKGYESGWPFISAKAKNDTLYLSYVPSKTNYLSEREVNGEYVMLATIGVKGVESIELNGNSYLNILAEAHGQNSKGETVYKEKDRQKYEWKVDKLDIKNNGASGMKLFLDAKKVNMDLSNCSRSFAINGKIEHLTISDPVGTIGISSVIKTDSLTVTTKKGFVNSGMISADVKDYIDVKLNTNMHVNYKGHPSTIRKKITSYGRLIDTNDYRPKEDPYTRFIKTLDTVDVIQQEIKEKQRAEDPDELIKMK